MGKCKELRETFTETIAQLEKDQLDKKTLITELRERLKNEKLRLKELKETLAAETKSYTDERDFLSVQPCPPCAPCHPCPPDAPCRPPPTIYKENLGEYTVCVQDPYVAAEEEEDLKTLVPDSTDFETKDAFLVQFEKTLANGLFMKMQVEARMKPRKTCPCKEDGPDACKPHSHTNYYKADMKLHDVCRLEAGFKASTRFIRTDRIRNRNPVPFFCTELNCLPEPEEEPEPDKCAWLTMEEYLL